MATIKFRRGINNNRLQLVPAAGEPLFTTDTKKLFIGDGVTVGGIPVQPYVTSTTPAVGDLVTFEDTTGFKLKPVAKATFLAGYYTSTQVDQLVAGIVAGEVTKAALADNATKFDNKTPADFVQQSQVTQSYTETSATKVPSAAALKAAHDDSVNQILQTAALLSGKVDKASISQSTSSTDQTAVASSAALKQVNDLAAQANTKGTQGISDASTAMNRANAAYTLGQTAQNAAQAARSAPDLSADRKRSISYGTAVPSGANEEGTVYIQY